MFSKILKRKTDNNSSAASNGIKGIANPKLEIRQEYVDNTNIDKAVASAETLTVSANSKALSAAPKSTTSTPGVRPIMRSRGNAQSASSTTRKRPNVRFGNIIVREFSSGIGGSVASAGPSVGLGQVLKREEEIGIDDYEKNEHGGRRAMTPLEFWLPPAVRLQRLGLLE